MKERKKATRCRGTFHMLTKPIFSSYFSSSSSILLSSSISLFFIPHEPLIPFFLSLHSWSRFTISTKETDSGLVSELTAPTTSRPDSGTFTCTAWNAYGQSELSNRVLVEEVPDPPFGLKVSEVGSKGINLRWSPPFTGNIPLNKYVIQWKRENGSCTFFDTLFQLESFCYIKVVPWFFSKCLHGQDFGISSRTASHTEDFPKFLFSPLPLK